MKIEAKPLISCLLLSALLVSWQLAFPAQTATKNVDDATARQWIQEMKASPRGPFSAIRWFCKDGTVLPPRPYACRPHGGGHQHGAWSERTLALREQGYIIANFLAGLDAQAFVARPNYKSMLKQMLLEHFLIDLDDGWILRQARFYRGAYQAEDEAAGGRELLRALLGKPDLLSGDFLLIREGVRLLPHGRQTKSVGEVRQLASQLANKHPGFKDLKNKIHSKPELADAEAVRNYAQNATPGLQGAYAELARSIEEVYAPGPLEEVLAQFCDRMGQTALATACSKTAARAKQAGSPGARLAAIASLLVDIRQDIDDLNGTARRLDAMDLSLALEQEFFRTATLLRDELPNATRSQRLAWMETAVASLYGTGLLSEREWQALRETFAVLRHDRVPLKAYKESLDYLARVPGWAGGAIALQFKQTMDQWARIEPLSIMFDQDRLRSSPLLFYSDVLDTLLRDANKLSGVRNELFGEDIGTGVRGLNPGIARGTLRGTPPTMAEFDRHGIYLLPETTAELPPVAGILTAGEGNPLSHVQLLARNLGIPNVAVDDALIPAIRKMEGKPVVLAVSPGGSVMLAEDRGQWHSVLPNAQRDDRLDVQIRPDLEKLDLSTREIMPTSQLRASDSGKIVGPKAAKVGELQRHYPDAVAPALAIPFGVFRELLNQPMPGEGKSVYDWMVEQYARLGAMPKGSQERMQATEAFRRRLQNWILRADPGDAFREKLRSAMERVFGPEGSYGVFVRSDTNVEDLPDFTGAGLNLTVPHVVGFDNVVQAISEVWASPFSKRAFAWRQAHMSDPQHVYPAVLLMKSVDVDKSGVLVTQDIDTGSREWLSVAINEGVGGAVDGQAAESVRIRAADGRTRLLAQATAPTRRILKPQGGVANVPSTGNATVLEPAEAQKLADLARDLPSKFPQLLDDQGNLASADVEFGFLDGKLRLFQIRPFVESAKARSSDFLQSLDSKRKPSDGARVDMNAVPSL